jgi:hypothetical protein
VTHFDPRSVASAVAERVVGKNEIPLGADTQAGSYRTPRVFAIGRANDLMRSAATSSERDSRNWYCYC